MTQSYGYDGLNRLSSASEGTGWAQTYDYGRYPPTPEVQSSAFRLRPAERVSQDDTDLDARGKETSYSAWMFT